MDVNSQYGNYAMTLFSSGDAWDTDKMYTIANDDSESTAEAGTLVNGQAKNIPAPAAGLYLFDVSLKELTYKTYAVGNNIYCYYGIEGITIYILSPQQELPENIRERLRYHKILTGESNFI